MGKSWTFTRKLGAGFATMVAFVVLMAAIAVQALNAAGVHLDHVTSENLPYAVRSAKLSTVAENEMSLFRGYLVSDDPKLHTDCLRARDELTRQIEQLRSSGLATAEIRADLDSIKSAAEAYFRAQDESISARKAGKSPDELDAMFEAKALPLARAFRERLGAFEALTHREVAADTANATSAARRSLLILMAVALGIIAFCAAIAVTLTRGLSRQVGLAVSQIESASTELQSAANQQAAGIKEQSTALTEVTTTLNQLLSSSRQIAESAQSVAGIAGDTSQASSEGEQGMNRSTAAVGGIRSEVDRIVEHMLELGKKSQQIGGVVDLINELSEQTNILAINATIEAAGAGEQGVRFGAVAEEIRKLAARVGNATKEIRALVDQVRSAVSATVMATETGSKTVDEGQRQIKETAGHFQRIAAQVDITTQAAREIELSTKQQASAVEQVNVAIVNVSQASKEASASAAQTLQTARELVTLSGELARLVRAQERA